MKKVCSICLLVILVFSLNGCTNKDNYSSGNFYDLKEAYECLIISQDDLILIYENYINNDYNEKLDISKSNKIKSDYLITLKRKYYSRKYFNY